MLPTTASCTSNSKAFRTVGSSTTKPDDVRTVSGPLRELLDSDGRGQA
jgi:hypothetical protein